MWLYCRIFIWQKMKAVDIIWETDGADVNLPTEMEIPSDVDTECEGLVADYLSDQTGFLVLAYTIERP